MEETGCDQGQAELAMSSAGYDLEKAIRTIGTLLRNIVVVKAKFVAPQRNVYGLVILIGDIKRRTLLRIRAVVSYNPAIFEEPLDGDWYDFERSLYAYRLWEGTLQQVTQDLERDLLERLEKDEDLYDDLKEGRAERLREKFGRFLSAHFPGVDELRLATQEVNLEQFRRIRVRDDEATAAPRVERPSDGSSGENLLLQVDLEQHSDGTPAREVRAGDSVHVLLTDGRDIARYLAKLLGGMSKRGVTPLVLPVEEIRQDGDTVHFRVRLSGAIVGVAEVSGASLLRVQKRASMSWWRRLVPFA
jgi:hypothetical protein